MSETRSLSTRQPSPCLQIAFADVVMIERRDLNASPMSVEGGGHSCSEMMKVSKGFREDQKEFCRSSRKEKMR